MKLHSGSTVAIIGGGPAGTACAIRLKREAGNVGQEIRVVLFEGKDFSVHYNQCVGVLSPPFLALLQEELGLTLPARLVKQKIRGYHLHCCREELLLANQETDGPTYAVRRSQFDRYLLEEARSLGVEVIPSRVTGVEWVERGQPQAVRVYSEGIFLRADVAVGAFGLDEAMLSVFETGTAGVSGYRRPRSFLKSFVTKLHPADMEFVQQKFGGIVHAFLFPASLPEIEFGALTPKGDHIVVNIAGERVTSADMDAFLQLPPVSQLLPPFERAALHYYQGRFPTSQARNSYGDHYVLVGDATGWLRPFKGKGINTALITGARAGRILVQQGISRRALAHYAQDCRDLTSDFPYGLAVRSFTKGACRTGLFRVLVRSARTDSRLREAFYGAVSGQTPFRQVIGQGLSLRTLRGIWTALGNGRSGQLGDREQGTGNRDGGSERY
ncbi:MAG: NAD(P)/FAD-dependent oxidoreductase [Candidatus Tectomicrobia bacterium]|uniref:NAD(P)/FAD-dependent oxidoreductase n=1 Tax=Tectimicrobiota bacterium TaxID=2528274 RepID=A0A932CMR1_UNCTE|nr:NAD(P)/FAD-dependent oxidoreductase [Candidatus Tectomicrobia bacterium]